MGGWVAATLWAKRQTRRRWRALVVLGVLAGLTAGLATAAAAGARRTETALARLESTTNSTDAIVFTSQVQDVDPTFGRLAARAEVAALAPWDLLFGFLAGQPGGVLFASDDGRWGTVVDKPVVLQGRMWNRRASDEMVIDDETAAFNHVRVGDVIPFHAYGPDQQDTQGAPTGARIGLRVVGIVHTTEEFLFAPSGIVSPGVVARYRHQMFVAPNAMIRLTGGAGGIAALRHDASALVTPGVPVLDLHSAGRRITTTLNVESVALWVLSLAVILGGGLLVLLVLSRSVSLMGDDVRALRALGLTRRDLAGASLVTHAVAVVVAAVTGGMTAFLLSPVFPVGEGRQVDPDPGFHADWVALGIGLAATVVVLVLVTVALSLATLRSDLRRQEARPSAIVTRVRRVAPLPVSLGTAAAFERAPGARGTPVRPALVGAIVGVLGVVGALTIDHGIHDALDNPQLAGVTFGTTINPLAQDVTATSVSRTFVDQVQRAVPDGSLAVVRRNLIDVDGVGVPTFSMVDVSRRAGPISLVTVSGRAPRLADEAAIGPATAKALGVHVGDSVRVAGRLRVRLVGEALFPSDVHSEFDEGLWLVPSTFNSVAPPPTSFDEVVAVRFPNGASEEGAALRAAEAYQAGLNVPANPIDHLVAALGGPQSDLGQQVQPSSIPLELTNLGNVALLPELLSIFLVLLALAALSFVLVASRRSRRLEFAVLRAMGLAPGAARQVVYWQATAIAVVGVVVGVPLGVAVGRWAWRAVTHQVPLVYSAPLELAVVLIAIPATLVLANVVAMMPARSLSSLRPAEILRTE